MKISQLLHIKVIVGHFYVKISQLLVVEKIKILDYFYLANNIFSCETNNHTVFWGVILVLVLNDKSSSCIVISFTL